MIRGNFIVLEGIDGSGTTTQAEEIMKEFTKLGLAAHVTAEPSKGPVGAMIRQILSGRLVTRIGNSVSAPGWTTMSLLFAADRQDHLESEIEPNLRDGVNVICDRYLYSSVIYQSVSSAKPETVSWISEINKHAKKPDLVLYIKVNPVEALRRCRERDEDKEIFEEPVFQKKLAVEYDKLEQMFNDVNIVTIDGDRSVKEIAADCWTQIENMRNTGAPQ